MCRSDSFSHTELEAEEPQPQEGVDEVIDSEDIVEEAEEDED